MFRPVTLKADNEYELVLMRNRREELMDVSIDYIDSIDFEMGERLQQPTKITLTIPSKIRRHDRIIDVPLFSKIKGKMQLKLKMNGKYYMFSIEEESVVEAKDSDIKTIVAYEKQYRFNTVDFSIATNVATRQLYKEPNETIEVSDGMLNWFEQQTGWRVNRITSRAKNEVTMASETERADIASIDKTVTGSMINNVPIYAILDDVPVSIAALEGKPLNMTIVMSCSVYSSNGEKYIDQDVTFNFVNLPYAIETISAKYVSTKKNFYGIEFTIKHTNGNITTQEFPFVNCKNLRLVAQVAVEWELGNLVERTVTKYRTFDTTITSWMAMLQTIAEAFDVIILFDSYNETINVCHREEFGEMTNVALTYDNAIKEITKQRKLDELVTRLTVESANTTIAGVNILGTDYVECYDYFINNGIMSEELQEALLNYNKLLEQKDIEFNNKLVDKHNADQELSLANSQLVSLQSKYSTEKAILTAYIKEDDKEKQAAQQEIVQSYEKQVENKLIQVQKCKDKVAEIEAELVKIGADIRKENTGFFTDELLQELNDYLIEKAITDDVHLTAYAVYDYVMEQIQQYQKPVIEFTIDTSMEFVKRTGRKVTDCMFLGAKMEVEDKAGEIAALEGTVMIYAFSICPKDDTVSNVKFMNGAKVPDSPLKQVSKVSQTAKATKSMTDFYKSTLAKIKDQNPDVAKILEEGLDLASQKVRSRTEKNIIEMDEAGIFLIDAQDETQQLALINDLIAMTTDKWKTCRVAISPEGIMAEELIGKIIIGENLYLGNDTNSFKITKDTDSGAYGMFLYTKKSDVAHLRVFLGIDKDNQPKLTFFDEGVTDFSSDEQRAEYMRIFLGVNEKNEATLIMRNRQSNSIVISPNGMFNCYQISDRDSFDKNNPFKSSFYIPTTLDVAFTAKLIINIEPFRAYSKTAKSTKIPLNTTENATINLKTTEDGNVECDTTETTSFKTKSTEGSGKIPVSMNVTLNGLSGSSGYYDVSGSGNSTSMTGTAFTNGGRTTGSALDSDLANPQLHTHYHWVNLSHSHGVSVSCGQHKHSITVSGTASGTASADTHTHDFTVPTHSHAIVIPKHKHSISMPSHSHSIEMPEHEHEAIYGIYEANSIPNCSVYLNGIKLADLNDKIEKTYEFDITSKFKGFKSGINVVEFRTEGLARASFTMFWSGYYEYE